MIIALTGTPGTGKTCIANVLHTRYSIETIHIHSFAKHKEIIEGFDKKRKSDIIDIDILNERIMKHVKNHSRTVLDGHLSHLLSCVSRVIVLRCHPLVLKERLKEKHWNKKKICENVEAEILDIILTEAVEVHAFDHVIEINTTHRSAGEAAKIIHRLITSDFSDAYSFTPGKIDWSEFVLSDEFRWRGLQNGS